MFLASVNFLLFLVGATQTGRVLSYQASKKGETVEGALKDELKRDEGAVEKFVEDPKGAVKSVTNPK
jgi:mitochondrial pyruvate carrier 2